MLACACGAFWLVVSGSSAIVPASTWRGVAASFARVGGVAVDDAVVAVGAVAAIVIGCRWSWSCFGCGCRCRCFMP